MDIRQKINEGSTFDLLISLSDTAGQAVPVVSGWFSVIDKMTGALVVAQTPLSAQPTGMGIHISAADNAMHDPDNKYERRLITVSAQYASGVETQEFEYLLVNLAGIN